MALNNKTAFSKRAEQLKRYEDSETNRESVVPKSPGDRRVRFSTGCIFLAACAAGDKDEVLKMLNGDGADIDTANVDGLTALHQACIEDNLDMVEFLVTHGADVNRKDNEGWTPLHATSSCGIVSIARYLIENGADLASVNSDGELPIDIAGTNAMADLLQTYINEQGIDCDDARQQEEKTMLADAKKWLRSDANEADRPHAKTGATALHVAAAKGYTNVLGLLLAGKADVDRQDNDGWTALMAACYWGKKEAAQMLIASVADMDLQNYSNQTCIDLAPKDMVAWLEECRKNNKRTKRRPASQINRISDNLDNNIELPPKVIRVEFKQPSSDQTKAKENDEQIKSTPSREQMQLPLTKENSNEEIGRNNAQPEKVPDKENQTNDSEVILRRTQSFENDDKFYQKYIELRARIKANSCPTLPATQIPNANNTNSEKEAAAKQTSNFIIQRSASLKDHRSQLSKKNNDKTPPTSPTPSTPSTPATTPLGNLRRSFVPPTRDEESETQRKAHAKRVRETRRSTQGVTLDEIKSAEQLVKMKNANNNTTNGNTETSEPNERLSESSTTAPAATEDSSEVNKEDVNVNYTISSPLRKAFRAASLEKDGSDEQKISATFTIAPPPRSSLTTSSISQLASRLEKDLEPEESNSVTATINVPLIPPPSKSSIDNSSDRISKKTDQSPPIPQPRSLFDIDNATSAKLADKLQQEAKKCDLNSMGEDSTAESSPSSSEPLGHFTDPLPPSPIHHTIFGERRPSWRMRTDFNNKFKLEETSATSSATPQQPTSPTNGVAQDPLKTAIISSVHRKQNSTENVPNHDVKEASTTPNRSDDDKENDKENDSRGATQGIIQRRRRPKRRSTGVVHVDMDDIDPDNRHDSPVDAEENRELSGNESRSRAESLASNSLADTNDDGEFVDYKALYEAAKADNDRLRSTLKSRDQDLAAAKAALERLTAAATKSSLSENEKREKRAMERKISEMEEELKQMDVLKTENQRLKDENGALIRVISKLSK